MFLKTEAVGATPPNHEVAFSFSLSFSLYFIPVFQRAIPSLHQSKCGLLYIFKHISPRSAKTRRPSNVREISTINPGRNRCITKHHKPRR